MLYNIDSISIHIAIMHHFCNFEKKKWSELNAVYNFFFFFFKGQ